MRTLQRIVMLAALAVMDPALALADVPHAPTDGHVTERQLVDKYRATDPAHYARLRHNLAVFRALPPERQEAIRKLDRDLQDEPLGRRQRLDRVLDRYADWLDRLSEADRQSVLAATDRKTRLERIRAVREQQWLKRLTKAQSDKIAKLDKGERSELIKKMRQEELDDRLDWLAAQRHWEMLVRTPALLPTRADMLGDDAREMVEKSLRPLLSKEEEKQLKDAEGKWPRYPRVLAELIESHPLSVQGPIGPTTIKDLQLKPLSLVVLQNEKKLEPVYNRLKNAEGKWPAFGVAVKDLMRTGFGKQHVAPLPEATTPAHLQAFPPNVQQVVEKRLMPALDGDELGRLNKAEGHWPDYPNALLELAKKHNVPLPSLPRIEAVDRYRWRSLTNPGIGRRGEVLWMLP
jgi:hypothetical protein